MVMKTAFGQERDDDDRAEFDPWPHRHPHRHHHVAPPSGGYRTMIVLAVAVIGFMTIGDLVLLAMSLHPAGSISSPSNGPYWSDYLKKN